MNNLSNLIGIVDMRAFYEKHGCIISGRPTNSKEGKEWACSCAACGGIDRASFWESGRYCCIRGCGVHVSSPYWFLRDIEGFSHSQACEELDIDPLEVDSYSLPDAKLPLFLTRDEPPCQRWQDAAEAFCQRAARYLWTPAGGSALQYLHARGLNDETMKRAGFGFCPGWYNEALSTWGLSEEQTEQREDLIKIPEGIIIPWRVDGHIWKIQVRRPDTQYFQVLGSSDCLYNIDSFQPSQAALLVESEIDARSAEQEAGELVACLATGSTTKALTGKWIARLFSAERILQSFDDDQAGEVGAAEWLRVLPNGLAYRWKPWSHDVNDMLKAGLPVRLWIKTGLQVGQVELASIEVHQEQFSPPALPVKQKNPASWAWMPRNDRGLPVYCVVCRQQATRWGTGCEPYCEKHCPWARDWPYSSHYKTA